MRIFVLAAALVFPLAAQTQPTRDANGMKTDDQKKGASAGVRQGGPTAVAKVSNGRKAAVSMTKPLPTARKVAERAAPFAKTLMRVLEQPLHLGVRMFFQTPQGGLHA
jgi:hypothetical protein